MGALVLILAILVPPRSFFYRLLIDELKLKSLFPFLMTHYPMPGGLAGQLINYMRLAGANSAEAGNWLMVLVASCLVTLSLTLWAMFFWRRVVDRTPRPTLLHVLLAVLAAVASSLVLTPILCCLEFPFATTQTQGFTILILLSTPVLYIAQLLFAPILFIGGAILVKWQARAQSRIAAQDG
jgi:hypothetical protein